MVNIINGYDMDARAEMVPKFWDAFWSQDWVRRNYGGKPQDTVNRVRVMLGGECSQCARVSPYALQPVAYIPGTTVARRITRNDEMAELEREMTHRLEQDDPWRDDWELWCKRCIIGSRIWHNTRYRHHVEGTWSGDPSTRIESLMETMEMISPEQVPTYGQATTVPDEGKRAKILNRIADRMGISLTCPGSSTNTRLY